ncbi:Flavodoxin [Terribacillus sp. AE2B 122]|jgi:flavodoxin I|nr:Flavodoxin [Terribacillus sp. AE2B 122]
MKVASVLIAFTSMSGNTEEMADIMEKTLEEKGVEVTKLQIDIDQLDVFTMTDYDGILMGTYTWGDGDIPYEIEDFYDELDDIELDGKPVALFGSCDSIYASYGAAIDTFQEKFKERGAEIVLETLKVDLSPEDEDIRNCQEFAASFASEVEKERSL